MRIYMSRHGESVNNMLNIIGGDCQLSDKGKKYSKFIGEYFNNRKIIVWTSELQRTKETASQLNAIPITFKNLNEIDAGDFDGFNLDNIRLNYTEQYLTRNNNKLTESYPNGESYLDLQKRVITAIDCIDMSNDGILLIIAHQAVCRVIYSYFTKKPLEKCTNLKINLHTIYRLDGNKFIPIKANI